MDQDMCHSPTVLPEMPTRLCQGITKQLFPDRGFPQADVRRVEGG